MGSNCRVIFNSEQFIGVSGSQLPENCGHPTEKGIYVQDPWFVSVEYHYRKRIWRGIGGGTIIHKSWILTAVHCVESDKYAFHLILINDQVFISVDVLNCYQESIQSDGWGTP